VPHPQVTGLDALIPGSSQSSSHSQCRYRVAVSSAVAASLTCGVMAMMVSRGSSMLMEGSASSRTSPKPGRMSCVVTGLVRAASSVLTASCGARPSLSKFIRSPPSPFRSSGLLLPVDLCPPPAPLPLRRLVHVRHRPLQPPIPLVCALALAVFVAAVQPRWVVTFSSAASPWRPWA